MKSMDNKVFVFKPKTIKSFPELKLPHGNLYDIWKQAGNPSGLDYTSPSGNRVVLNGEFSSDTLKRINIYMAGTNNHIELTSPKRIGFMDIVSLNGSEVKIGSPTLIGGLTVLCSEKTSCSVGDGAMISRDVIMYASKAHGLYNVSDGARRFKSGIDVADRVWIGQSARILAGAHIGENTVIGAYSVLSGKIPNNCAAAGNPCKVTSRNVFWVEHAVKDDGNYLDMLKDKNLLIPKFIRNTES